MYFTSLLGLRNVDSLPIKIMRWSAARGMEIVAQRANQETWPGPVDPYQLNYPNVSGDGA